MAYCYYFLISTVGEFNNIYLFLPKMCALLNVSDFYPLIRNCILFLKTCATFFFFFRVL